MREFNPEPIPAPAVEARPWSDEIYDLEIGAGAGLFAIRYARENPERRLLAIERTQTKFDGMKQRWMNHDLPNLHCLRADAVAYVVHRVRPRTLARVFLLYPNPYPKAKHANLRWYNSPFLAHLSTKMIDGGTLTLATNLEWYAAEAGLTIPARFDFELTSNARLSDDHRPRTHFEKKYLARGENCFDLVFRRT